MPTDPPLIKRLPPSLTFIGHPTTLQVSVTLHSLADVATMIEFFTVLQDRPQLFEALEPEGAP